MKKILVVDDDVDILEIVKSFLSRNHYTVSISRSCSEGLDFFYKSRPDLVILDIGVGDEDGRDMCKKIKAQAE